MRHARPTPSREHDRAHCALSSSRRDVNEEVVLTGQPSKHAIGESLQLLTDVGDVPVPDGFFGGDFIPELLHKVEEGLPTYRGE